jgi:RsmE family RNA methyltransferase
MAATELGEKSYADSTIFREREFRRPLLEGAEQAGNPRLPAVSVYPSLAECLAALPPPASVEERWALDPYRSECRLGGVFGAGRAIPESVLLAVGSERGWTDRELDSLAEKGFRFASLGDRILRTETACTAAVVLALAGRGII